LKLLAPKLLLPLAALAGSLILLISGWSRAFGYL
jgi:hypothetical protein